MMEVVLVFGAVSIAGAKFDDAILWLCLRLSVWVLPC